VVRRWLKAGVLEGDELFPTEAGTPQGGVLSPLLANVALHGLEAHIRSAYPASHRRESWRPTVVRYADDFVVLHPDRRVIEQIRAEVGAWLTPLGLELKPAKTRIAHTLNRLVEGEAPGFDFLGFRVRQYPCGKTHAGKASRGRGRAVPKGFKTLVTPSQSAQKRHQAALGEIVRAHRGASQAELIRHLNPVTRGWSGYFRAAASKRTFSKMAHLLFRKLWRWARRRHPRKSRRWVARTYWRPASGRWDFATPDGARLYEHPRMRIVRHTKVRGNRSPFDGDSVYWSARLGRFPDLPTGLARQLRRQEGRCAACGMFLTLDDVRALDQPGPDPQGGTPRPPRSLVHRHCRM
jgi:RNA-directed DNA polymerase